MKSINEIPHVFFATRNGMQKGTNGTEWWKYCDECGEEKDNPIHQVSKEEQDKKLIAVLEAIDETD